MFVPHPGAVGGVVPAEAEDLRRCHRGEQAELLPRGRSGPSGRPPSYGLPSRSSNGAVAHGAPSRRSVDLDTCVSHKILLST